MYISQKRNLQNTNKFHFNLTLSTDTQVPCVSFSGIILSIHSIQFKKL